MGKLAVQHFDLFNRSVLAVVGVTQEDAIINFNDYADKQKATIGHIDNIGTASGWCQVVTGDIYIWVEDKENPSTLLHEIVHAAFKICEVCDIAIDEELICRLVAEMKLGIFDSIYHGSE